MIQISVQPKSAAFPHLEVSVIVPLRCLPADHGDGWDQKAGTGSRIRTVRTTADSVNSNHLMDEYQPRCIPVLGLPPSDHRDLIRLAQ